MAPLSTRARSSAGPAGFIAAIVISASVGVLLGALIATGGGRRDRRPALSPSLVALKVRHRDASPSVRTELNITERSTQPAPSRLELNHTERSTEPPAPRSTTPGPALRDRLTVSECLKVAVRDAQKHADEVAKRLPDTGPWKKLAYSYVKSYMINIDYFAYAGPNDKNTTFVVTGDIFAMWLRDSAAQLHVYIGMAKSSQCMRVVLEGLIRQQADLILQDAYANAFHAYPKFAERILGRGGYVFTRNYEVDSLAYFVRLVYMYWAETGAEDVFDGLVDSALRRIAVVWALEKDHTLSSYVYKELAHQGNGPPTAVTGMTWNAFRPSDDKCVYSYNIPANVMAETSLRQMAEIQLKVYKDWRSANFSNTLADEIREGIMKHGIIDKGESGKVYAYEVDGLGKSIFMDDANVPSLLSIPYLLHKPQAGEHRPAFPFPSLTAFDDEIYANTRRLIMDSKHNPYFFKGKVAEGIGSPHTALLHGQIWPMSIIMRGLTAPDVVERKQALLSALKNTGGTGMQHESFWSEDSKRFTRTYFGWPNALFAELVEQMLMNGDFATTGSDDSDAVH